MNRNTSSPEMMDQFLRFLNETLPTIERSRRKAPSLSGPIEADTLLFETGQVDSLSILHLIAFVESETGREVPAKMIVMKHFRTPLAIAESFLTPQPETA